MDVGTHRTRASVLVAVAAWLGCVPPPAAWAQDTPEGPGTPQVEGAPEGPDAPDTQGTPGGPDEDVASDTPDAGETPVMPARVVVRLPACAATPIDTARLLELLRIELTSDGVEELIATDEAADGADPALAVISLAADPCDDAALRFVVAVDDLATHKRVERGLHVADVEAGARERALAIAVAELLRGSWAELVLHEPAAAAALPPRLREGLTVRLRDAGWVEPPAPEPGAGELTAPAAPAVPAPASPRASVEATVVVLAFVGARTSPIGARLGLVLPLARLGDPRDAGDPGGPRLSLGLRVEAEAATGRSLDPLGDIQVGVATGAVGLHLALTWGRLTVDLGPRLAVGWGWARGEPSDPATIAGDGGTPVVLGAAETTVSFEVVGRLRAVAGLEVGGALRRLEALVDDVPVAGVSGAQITARLGFALRL